ERLAGYMKTTRRRFIKFAAASAGAFALNARSTTLFAEKSVKPLRILILGGTGFTGPYQVRYALSRGHKVTTFNRGKTHPGELPNEVEQLVGDRNGKLDALKNRQWDVAIDNPTTLPAWVRDAAQVLKGNVERYVFISTISVYPDPLPAAGVDENSPLSKYDGPDAYKETLEAMRAGGFKTYGPLKVLSEKEAEKSNATFTFVPYDFLKQQKVEAWSDMPVWAGDELGLSRLKIDRALSKGLTFRPLADTARDTLAWFKALPQDRQSKMRAGITAEREREVLEAWKKKL